MTDPTDLLRASLASLEEIDLAQSSEGSLEELARRIDLIQQSEALLRAFRDEISELLGSGMEADEIPVDGLGLLRRKARLSSSWLGDESRERMHSDALMAIVNRVATDPSSGEIHANLARVAAETWRLTSDAFSLGADPKAAFRKVLGLNPDEYRTRRITGYTVTVSDGISEEEAR